MSELKVIHAFDVYEEYTKTGDDEAAQVYLKSEADKVIAEKDKEIQRLENLCESYRIDCDNLAIREANAYKEIERDNKQLRHQKYKRCLAMAKWCRESLRLMRTYEVTEDFWNLEPGQDAEYFCKKGDFYSKWRKCWLALAEEPTWEKFLQLIHNEGK